MIRIVSFLSIAACAMAQTPVDPNRFVPADAVLTVRIQSPAVWRDVFGKTKAASILGSAKLAPELAKARDGLDQLVDAADRLGMPRDVLLGLWNDYRGEIVVSVCMDPIEIGPDGEPAEPSFAAMIAMTPDGAFGLDKLLAGFRATDEKADIPLVDIQIGGQHFRRTDTHANTGFPDGTQAEFVDDHLVMFVGDAIERLGPAMLANTNRATGPKPSAPVSAHFDLRWLLEVMRAGARHAASEADAEVDSETIEAMFAAAGLMSLRSFDFAVTAVGDRLACDAELHLDGDVGLLGMFVGDASRPKLLRAVPAQADSFSVSVFDTGAIWRAVGRIAAAIGEQGPSSLEAIEASFAETTGVRLREDLLDHLGSETLVLGDVRGVFQVIAEQGGNLARPDPNRVFADWCYGLALRNGKALAASVDKVLRKFGLHAARKTEDYAGQRVHTLRLAGALSIEYAITDDLLLLVIGDRGEGVGHLRAVLDTLADKNPHTHDAITRWSAVAPEGWNGLGVVPVLDLVRAAFDASVATRRGRQPAVDEAIAYARVLLDDLQSLGLAELASATYTSPHRLRWLWLW